MIILCDWYMQRVRPANVKLECMGESSGEKRLNKMDQLNLATHCSCDLPW